MKIEESAVHYCVGLYPKRMIVSSYLGKRAKCRISILGGGGEIKNCRYILFLSSTFHWRDGVVFFISRSRDTILRKYGYNMAKRISDNRISLSSLLLLP